MLERSILGSRLGVGEPAAQVGPLGEQMPIYEYECRECQNRFESLVLDSTPPECPACQATDLERLMSSSAVSSDGTKKRNLEHGRKSAQKTQDEKAHAEHEAIHHHHH